MATILWDQSRFDATLRAALVHTSRSVKQFVLDQAYSVVINTMGETHKADRMMIEGSLQAFKAHELTLVGKRGVGKGLRFSKAKSNVKYSFGNYKEAPLLALIVQSRTQFGSHPSSKGRLSPWYGVSRAEGAARMLAEMRKVIGARLSSIGFIKSGWIASREYLRSQGARGSLYTTAARVLDERADAAAAHGPTAGGALVFGTEFNPSVTIWNSREEAKHANAAAVIRYGAEGLQKGLNIVEADMRAHLEATLTPICVEFNAKQG
jgi:hypothetical protein